MKTIKENVGKKIPMIKTYSNHRGSLLEGEKVTLISLNEQKEEVEVNDPFGVSWTIPLKFIHIY
tara:strand:+ start:397 stop:588 length:192 start_codon:yes stop_codon:yes gene_type:complete